MHTNDSSTTTQNECKNFYNSNRLILLFRPNFEFSLLLDSYPYICHSHIWFHSNFINFKKIFTHQIPCIWVQNLSIIFCILSTCWISGEPKSTILDVSFTRNLATNKTKNKSKTDDWESWSERYSIHTKQIAQT